MRARHALLWASCLPALVSLAGCVSVSEFRKLERDVRAVQRGGGGGATTSGSREQLADVAARLDSLQSDLRRIEGRLEVAEHRSTQALEEARKARRDAQGAPEAAAVAPDTPTPAPDEPSPLGTPATAPRSTAPTAGTAPAPASSAGAAPAASASVAPPAPADDAASGASAEEVQAYRNAFAAWQRNDPDACVDQFRQFLQSHPTSIYADDGAYWMADCYFKKGDYKTAVLRFDDVVARYPKGNKAADALYRHGESLLRLGPGYQKAAQRAFERVTEEYPSSPRSAEAKKQIEQLAGKQTAAGAKPSGGGR